MAPIRSVGSKRMDPGWGGWGLPGLSTGREEGLTWPQGRAGPHTAGPCAVGWSLGPLASHSLGEAGAGTFPGATCAYGLGEGWAGLHHLAGALLTLQLRS